MNTGFLSRTPRFRNVIDFNNERFLDVENEKISALEFGYSWLGKNAGININTYYTVWQNRPFDGGVSVEINDEIVRANINAMDARHMGIEIAGSYEVGKKVDIDVAMSFGDWIWTSQDSVNFFDQNRNLLIDNTDPNNPVPYYRSFDAEGVLVGDAPQTQITAAVRYAPIKDAYIKPRITFFDKYYADFDPLGLSEEKAGRQSWKIPAYSLLDIHAGYTFRFDYFNIGLNASIFNTLDASYFADAQNNEGTAIVTLGNGYSPERTVAFDANSAGVIIGYGRRFNFGVELSF